MTKPIRSAIFNDSYFPITDGVAMVTKNYALWMNRLAGPSCVVTPDMPDFVDEDEFPVYRYPSLALKQRPPYRFGMDIFGATYRKTREPGGRVDRVLDPVAFKKLDIVHAHCPFSSGSMAKALARLKGIPLVATFHTKYKADFERALPLKILVDVTIAAIVRFYESADEVWVPSGETIETLREYGFKGRAIVMPNGTDLNVADAELPDLRAEGGKWIGVPEGLPVFLYLGQHIHEKNLPLLLDALEILSRRGLPYKMVFIGDGYARAEYEDRVRKAGLGDSIVFKGVVRDRETVKRAYARADILAFPSLYDTSSLIVKEAAGMRLAAALIDGSTTSEGVSDGRNGLLSANDAESYANRLAACIADPAIARKAGVGAYRTLYRSWENVILEAAENYRRLIREKSR